MPWAYVLPGVWSLRFHSLLAILESLGGLLSGVLLLCPLATFCATTTVPDRHLCTEWIASRCGVIVAFRLRQDRAPADSVSRLYFDSGHDCPYHPGSRTPSIHTCPPLLAHARRLPPARAGWPVRLFNRHSPPHTNMTANEQGAAGHSRRARRSGCCPESHRCGCRRQRAASGGA